MSLKRSGATDKASKAGITTSATGERVIASSTRADGSVRKEIRVRPGYRPPEDVEVYKNRTAEAFKNKGKGPVPGAEALEDNKADTPGQANNKNAKRREARKKAAASASETAKEGPASGHTAGEQETDSVKDPEAEREKEAKKLAKKLRQAKDLKDKKDKGDTLLPEQFEKVIRINELIRQLDQLGFGPDGEKKQQSPDEGDGDGENEAG